MICASVVHICVMLAVPLQIQIIIESDLDFNASISSAIFCCNFVVMIFLFAWTVIGFLLHQEGRMHGVNDEQCGDVLLPWLIMQLVLDCVFPGVCCVCAVLCWLSIMCFAILR